MTSSITAVMQFGKAKGACIEAIQWLHTQDDAEHAWQTCDRPDWMIWYAVRRGVDRKIIVRIACDCARTALRFVPEGEDRPRLAIETTERWLTGETTIEEVRSARDAGADAYADADAAYADADADAAYAAAADAAAYAAAAYAAAAAAAAYAAADAADAAAYAYAAAAAADAADAAAADAAAAAAARRQANIQMCNIVRTYISYQDIAL